MATTLPATNETMTAAVKTGAGAQAVVVQPVPVPATPAGFVKVAVAAAGICGTDVHVAHDEYACEPPVVMGHEIAGRVVEVGHPRDHGWVGRRVACETYFSTCTTCDMCRVGRSNLCASRRSIGSFENGGFADFVVLPIHNLHALPDWLGDHDGALAEPLACIAQCLMDPPVIDAGDAVLVTGPGAMGQLAAQVASAHGAHVTLAGLPKDAARLGVAANLGITTTTGSVPADTFDVVIECSGTSTGAATALRAARPGAGYIQIGIFGKDISLPLDLILYKELTVSTGFASTPTSWRHAMALIEQQLVALAPLITSRVPIAEFAQALHGVQAGEGLKTVVLPEAAEK